MYTILIVEDEPCIRENLAECLPWEQWGFSVLATAENGRAALEQMRHALPDVILTDIRMPVMDGIALLKSVRDAHPQLPVVILSGHDDFEYARQALELGAYAYVLKLEIRSNLQQLMAKIKKDIENNHKDRAKRYHEKTALLRQVIIHTVLGHNPSMLSDYDESILKGFEYFLSVIRIEANPDPRDVSPHPAQTSIMLLLEQYLENQLRTLPYQRLLICMRADELMLFLMRKGGSTQANNSPHGWLQALAADLPRQAFAADHRFVIATSSHFHTYDKLYEVYHHTRNRTLYSPTTSSLLVDTAQPESTTSPDMLRKAASIERGLLDAIQLDSNESVLSQLELWIQHWNTGEVVDIVAFRQRCTWLFIALQQALGNAALPGVYTNLNTLENINSVPALSRWMKIRVAWLLDRRINAASDMSTRISRLQQYLSDHSLERISLTQIAEKMHMNPSYLSTCFKNTTGKSFSEYYSALRMNKARELLEKGYTVTRVSEMMCYSDVKSFRRMFKLQTGISPGDIRSK